MDTDNAAHSRPQSSQHRFVYGLTVVFCLVMLSMVALPWISGTLDQGENQKIEAIPNTLIGTVVEVFPEENAFRIITPESVLYSVEFPDPLPATIILGELVRVTGEPDKDVEYLIVASSVTPLIAEDVLGKEKAPADVIPGELLPG